ncbi:hypothetical protein [Oceanobacillus bengalensis]|uniref:hypothetical protein n=1 Tax=Oceanobacillus bengalensis TaxID=1435466 RepID=UPI001602FBE4|nr:hypothetical protein [Oceanobacillus bengalensis]
MRNILKSLIGLSFVLTLAACIGEDYDVAVPTAYLQVEIGLTDLQTQLTEANISWDSSSGKVEQTIENIEEFGLSQDEIRAFPNQEASFVFKENEENGGDIWTDPTIKAAIWKDGEQIAIELSDTYEFQLPTNEGNYVLEVEFANSPDRVQYVGNIVIEKRSEETKIVDGKLPDFAIMELPTIEKVHNGESENTAFDHSYEEVCWNHCDDNNIYNHTSVHAGDVEIGDTIQIDWNNIQPQPNEINFIHIHTEKNEVIKQERIDNTNTPLEIKVDEEKIDSQYALVSMERWNRA